MTVYKAFRNFYIFLISFAVLLGGLLGGFAAYKICYAHQNAVYAVSKYGSNGTEVMELQKKLKELGYYGGETDGVFGAATQNAVKKFQKSVGLTADGIAGSKTLLYLGLGGSQSSGAAGYTA